MCKVGMSCRVARNQVTFALVVLILLGCIVLNDRTFDEYTSIQYPFADIGRPSGQKHIVNSTGTKNSTLASSAKSVPGRKNGLGLPEFCDYCGPTDEICQRYGWVPPILNWKKKRLYNKIN
jgi:hypothetical protein